MPVRCNPNESEYTWLNRHGPPSADKSSVVDHPPHYTAGDVECIDAIRAAVGDEGFVIFCRATAIKYAWRASLKQTTRVEDDLRKGAWYLTKAADTIATPSLSLAG